MLKARLMRFWNGLRQRFSSPEGEKKGGKGWKYWILTLVGILLVMWTALGIFWSNEPKVNDVVALADRAATDNGQQLVVGYTTAFTLRHLADTLLNKPGGYLSNDVTPPSVILDNMPSWV